MAMNREHNTRVGTYLKVASENAESTQRVVAEIVWDNSQGGLYRQKKRDNNMIIINAGIIYNIIAILLNNHMIA